MTRAFIISMLVWIVFGQALIAQPLTYTSSSGHQYSHELNQNGAILTSVYPVARTFDRGAGTYTINQIEVIYLGRSCDAYSEVPGHGTWSWANGGFVIDFPTHGLGFPRQDIEANNGVNRQM